MNIDKIMKDAIIAEDNNREIPYGIYDRSWKKIHEKKSIKEKWYRKLPAYLYNFSFKEFAAVISFVLILVLIPTIASHYKTQNNKKPAAEQKLHYNSFDAPDKILISNHGNQVAITSTNPLYTKILELVDKRFNNQKKFGAYDCYLHQETMKEIPKGSVSLKFIYSSIQNSNFTVGPNPDGSSSTVAYNTLYMPLTDKLFYCYKDSEGSVGMGSLMISEELIKLASAAASGEDKVSSPISKIEAENLAKKTFANTLPDWCANNNTLPCPVAYVKDENRDGKDFYVFKFYQPDEINNTETVFAWYYINKNSGCIYELYEPTNTLINISPN